MPGSTTGKKLDLSKLTDEEAQHVWAVVQRDFDLRKKEEDRLGDLKTKIEKEDTKRELLGNQSSLTESYCIRCLQPFKFLVNTKRQCLDCQLYICKSCTRYNKEEHGWVCDSCHMARVLKIGTLEWYHENVRARFKRFGSAKVMRSLFTRLSGQHIHSQTDLEDGYEEHSMDAADSQHYKEAAVSYDTLEVDTDVRESMLTEANMASVFGQILKEKNKDLNQQEDPAYSDNQTTPSRTVSRLSYSSAGSGSARGPRRSSNSYLPGPEDSSGDEGDAQPFPLYQAHLGPLSHTSRESLNSSNPPPQITDLNRRVSAVETFLNHLEETVTSTYEQAPPTPNCASPLPQWEEVDDEEQQLRQKLHEMTDNISDHSVSSDEEEKEEKKEEESSRPGEDARISRIPTRPASRTSIIFSRLEEQQTDSEKTNVETDGRERMWCPLEDGSEGGFKGSTALLFELEDKVAQAAADVQNSQSEVSYIQNRIAALNAAGMHADKRRKSAIPVRTRRLSHNPPPNQVDRFVRNTIYRGSLTQRNPVAKPKNGATSAV